MLAPEDPRRPAVKVANPLSEDQPQLRTTLLPGLFRTLVRNIGRGFPDTGLFETGQVFLPRPGRAGHRADPRHRPGTHRGRARDARRRPARPADAGGGRAGRAARAARLVGTGTRRRTGPTRSRRPGRSARVCHLTFDVRAAAAAPWHPGRCAALHVAVSGADGQRHEWLAGHAGELHPRVIAAYGLPPRTGAFELDFAVLAAAVAAAAPVRGPALSGLPAGDAGRGARRGGGGARRRRGGRAHRRGGGTARGRAALRRLRRRPARAGPQVAGLHAAAAGRPTGR